MFSLQEASLDDFTGDSLDDFLGTPTSPSAADEDVGAPR